ncbi:hypothetical protein HY642_02340 [Candidatus Woesearchaeota archaeon]|nr:hypothetical protein [Candidatus Woesearchaeota archaeon]
MTYTHQTEHAHGEHSDRVRHWAHQAAELERKIHNAGMNGSPELYAAFAMKLNGIYHASRNDGGLTPHEQQYIETHIEAYMRKAGLDTHGVKELLHAGEEHKLERLILDSIATKMHPHKQEGE